MIKIENQNKVIYREVQRPRSFWWWLLVLVIAFIMWYGFIQQVFFGIPFGDKPAPDVAMVILWLIFGIAFPITMLGILKLIIEVHEDGLYIRFMPFHIEYRKFLYKDIKQYEPIIYSPFKRFGGWGIRMNFQGETGYILNGKQGLELKFKNQTVVIGTRKPDELKKAMDSIQKK